MAALLAQKGFTSGVPGIEGPRGLAPVTAASYDWKGDRWPRRALELHDNTYKPFPCGIVNHPTIDACIQLHGTSTHRPRRRRGASAARRAARQGPLQQDRIRVGLEGKFSVGHGGRDRARPRPRRPCASTPTRRSTTPTSRHSSAERATREADDPIVTEDGVRVELELTDGRVMGSASRESLGNLQRPLTDDARLEREVPRPGGGVITPAQAEEALRACWTDRRARRRRSADRALHPGLSLATARAQRTTSEDMKKKLAGRSDRLAALPSLAARAEVGELKMHLERWLRTRRSPAAIEHRRPDPGRC